MPIALAEECNKKSYYDKNILTIIEEEAAEMLACTITTEQAAAHVQNRASILVMERYELG